MALPRDCCQIFAMVLLSAALEERARKIAFALPLLDGTHVCAQERCDPLARGVTAKRCQLWLVHSRCSHTTDLGVELFHRTEVMEEKSVHHSSGMRAAWPRRRPASA